ncbi:E3 ubiquitin-protein ligase MBR2-like isoform X2 [Rhododendron vialii]|uniref:E3 ubiquitin-protein ligase MBR2-like isoform X2 n=1 Tax=Rhododendron vialii TaxID=182163 RepID=UPI00265F5236|nr:E3 ubiquitin-protein ligase MBR2-like isoform X2 [Rhododendron vialii]
MEDQRSSSNSISSFNHGSDVTYQGLIQQNIESVNTEYGWLPSPVSNVGASLILAEAHPEQNNHMSTSSGLVTLGSSTLQSATSDAVTANLDQNLAYDDSDVDADQEIGVDHGNQTSSLERNAALLRRNIRRRMNPANEQDFFNSSLSSASPDDSSQLFQPSYRNWVTSPSSTSNAVGSLFVATSGGYAFRQQENSQYIPRSASLQSMLVSGTERGNSSRQHLMTSRVVPRNYNSQNGASGTQLSHPLVFPQQNVTRSFPSSFTNVVHPSSVMRSAGIDSGGQVGYQMPQPSTAATAMMNIIQSRFGNGRAFQANDVVPRSLPPSQAVIDDQSRARLQRTVRQAFNILQAAGAFDHYEGGMIHGPSFFEEEPDVYDNLRLDVDNMSYEDLLALEDHIGHVGTGLTEETVLGALRRVTYQSMRLGTPAEEICVICQENFADCEELGDLDCGHKYHFDCLRQWLVHKNTCPICKTTALAV